jgi:hypothetical protein
MPARAHIKRAFFSTVVVTRLSISIIASVLFHAFAHVSAIATQLSLKVNLPFFFHGIFTAPQTNKTFASANRCPSRRLILKCASALLSLLGPSRSVLCPCQLLIRQPLASGTTDDRSETASIAVLVFPLMVSETLFVKVAEKMKWLDGDVGSL